ncbi:MAG: hypothetical protein EOP56_11390 [Sphingobacteriales bacterium]|nr:MAG: hypothetical protein EOP56_11390 [Sphingobacteriales bacterium]
MYSSLKQLFVLLFILLSGRNAFAQQQEGAPLTMHQIKIAPLRIIDFVNPGLEITYENHYAGNWATEVGGAFMHGFYSLGQREGYKGLRASAEQKCFFRELRDPEKYYSGFLSFETAYRNVSYYAPGAPSYEPFRDDYKVVKQTCAFNIKWGIQSVSNHFVFDFSVGIGLKYKSVQWATTGYNNGYKEMGYFAEPGEYWLPNIPLNVKLGYVF